MSCLALTFLGMDGGKACGSVGGSSVNGRCRMAAFHGVFLFCVAVDGGTWYVRGINNSGGSSDDGK